MPLRTHLHNGPPPHIKMIFCVVLQACNILQLPRWTISKFVQRIHIYDFTFCQKCDHGLSSQFAEKLNHDIQVGMISVED